MIQGLTACLHIMWFVQDIVHEGSAVSVGTKFIIRSDVMYVRDPPICTAPNDIRAYEMMRRAEVLEDEGKVSEAVALLRKCCKLSPDLAMLYGW